MFGGTGVGPTIGGPTKGETTLKRAFLMLVILIFDNMDVEEGQNCFSGRTGGPGSLVLPV